MELRIGCSEVRKSGTSLESDSGEPMSRERMLAPPFGAEAEGAGNDVEAEDETEDGILLRTDSGNFGYRTLDRG